MATLLALVLTFLVLALIYIKLKRINKYWDKKRVAYIKPFPILGNISSFVFRRKCFMDLLDDIYSKYPDERYVGVFQFYTPILIIRDLDLIRNIAVKDFDAFADHRGFGDISKDDIARKGLLNLKVADGWQDMRATLSPAFTSSKMRAMFSLIENCANQFVAYIQKQDEEILSVELKDTLTRLSNDVIGTTMFGVTCDSLNNKDNKFYVMGIELTNFRGIQLLKFVINLCSPKILKVLNIKFIGKDVTNFFINLIQESFKIRKEQGIIRPDMLHLLMEARHGRLRHEDKSNVIDTGFAVTEESELGKLKKSKMELTENDIIAQAMAFFFAGFETVSSTMCYVFYELARNPDIQERLHNEIKETCKENVTYETVLGMKYLDCVISETLRRWPICSVLDRVSTKPITIEPEKPHERLLHLDVGQVIWIPVSAIQKDEKHYPNPKKFDPERFNDENKKNIHPFGFLAFGSGPRNCIGSRFALLEMKIITVKALQSFEIVPTKETPKQIVYSMKTLNPLPEEGITVGFKRRNTKLL